MSDLSNEEIEVVGRMRMIFGSEKMV